MELICKGVEMESEQLAKGGIKVVVIGDRSRFSPEVKQAISRIEEITYSGQTMTFVLALNYSSRSEISTTVRNLAKKVELGELKAEQIDEKMISEALYTASMPDPDLVIRTSGECRLSNFLMWQASYAELYFTDVLWPDFDRAAFEEAMAVYSQRDRRYGLVKN
jgi:undecaprenyl diphosphate synthase